MFPTNTNGNNGTIVQYPISFNTSALICLASPYIIEGTVFWDYPASASIWDSLDIQNECKIGALHLSSDRKMYVLAIGN